MENTRESIANSLTGCPRVEDTILFAIPVCGPYESLVNYKFKVKKYNVYFLILWKLGEIDAGTNEERCRWETNN